MDWWASDFAGWLAAGAALVALALGFLAWRRPFTHARFADKWVIDHRSSPDFALIELVAEIAPLGSIMVSETKATLCFDGRRINLEPVQNHVGVALEGARALGFTFKLLSADEPVPGSAVFEAMVKLTDGTKAKTKRRWETIEIE